MKMRTRKAKKARCRRQYWVDSGSWAEFNRRGERLMAKIRALRKAYMDEWRAEQAATV